MNAPSERTSVVAIVIPKKVLGLVAIISVFVSDPKVPSLNHLSGTKARSPIIIGIASLPGITQ